ncbi:MAG: hypothetical protein IJ737_03825 [Ruminococcus sp.]|nr:hypothetical protein [Ruminococcus sp.]
MIMIKGISKQIVEIKCPDNEYFERALLFVNTSNPACSELFLREQGRQLTRQLESSLEERRAVPSRRSIDRARMIILTCTAACAGIGALLMLMFR